LNGTLADVPDAATGLVHQGNGRYYDPTLGRPLQPNPAGGPPAAPQALNRYAATPAGQVGVAAEVYQTMAGNRLSLSQYFLDQARGEVREGFAGLGVAATTEAYAREAVKGRLDVSPFRIFRIARAGYGDAFTEAPGGRYVSDLVARLGPEKYRSLDSGMVIDLSLVRRDYARFQPRFGFDESGLKRVLGGKFSGEFVGGALVELAFALPELEATWSNPYFTPGQQRVQTVVTLGGVGASAVVGAGIQVGVSVKLGGVLGAWVGPVGFVAGVSAGVGVNFFWDHAVRPGVSWVFVNLLQRPDPFSETRNLVPFKGN
jgi:hypothetical protein